MKKIFPSPVRVLSVIAILGILLAGAAQAFLYSVPVLDPQAVQALSDDKLLSVYLEVLIDLEASTTFSRTAGFNKNEYMKFKDLIRYRVRLFQEIKRRQLDIPETGAPCSF